jgi:hypothetical protein
LESGNRLTEPVGRATPIVELLVARYGSVDAAAAVYAERYGEKQDTAEKLLKRIRRQTYSRVTISTLDRLCVLAGKHLDLV